MDKIGDKLIKSLIISVLIVLDGISNWKNYGVDPSLFPKTLGKKYFEKNKIKF